MGRLDAAAQLQGLGALYPHRQRGVGAHMIGHCSGTHSLTPCLATPLVSCLACLVQCPPDVPWMLQSICW